MQEARLPISHIGCIESVQSTSHLQCTKSGVQMGVQSVFPILYIVQLGVNSVFINLYSI